MANIATVRHWRSDTGVMAPGETASSRPGSSSSRATTQLEPGGPVAGSGTLNADDSVAEPQLSVSRRQLAELSVGADSSVSARQPLAAALAESLGVKPPGGTAMFLEAGGTTPANANLQELDAGPTPAASASRPALARARQALRQQLLATAARLEGELRQVSKAAQVRSASKLGGTQHCPCPSVGSTKFSLPILSAAQVRTGQQTSR